MRLAWRHSLVGMLFSALASGLALHASHANPTGGQTVAGSAKISGQGTPNVTVTQSSASAIVNWNSFNIGAGEITRFLQPNASSYTLNRVTGSQNPSQILGTIEANGRIFLVNPDGFIFGTGAKINTASFLATTHDIRNADFMAGQFNFSIPGNPRASIINEGAITAASGGFAALVAPAVRNDGVIVANLGTVALAGAGKGFTLDLYGDSLIKLYAGDSVPGDVLSSVVSNTGTLRADGGKVLLSAATAQKVVDSVINTSGVIEARSVGLKNGMIVFGAQTADSKVAGAPVQTVKVSGKVDASGKRKGEKGGTVQITGEAIALQSVFVDASGMAAGGTILVGGDWGGGATNAAAVTKYGQSFEKTVIPTAATVVVDAGSSLNASAISSGNGGKVVVWGDQSTQFSGAVAARGGSALGDGGFVEVSSHGQLAFSGVADAAAPKGENGKLLLDPRDVTIGTTGAWVVTPSSIQSALANSDVIVTTSGSGGTDAGDITVAQGVSWSNGSHLTLNADRTITINDGVVIKNTGSGDLTLRADSGGLGVGMVNFLGTGKVDYSQSTGAVEIFYNPAGGHTTPHDYSSNVLLNSGSSTLTAYMLVNNVNDLQNIQQNLSGTYALGKDIDASATAGWNGGAGFLEIGQDYSHPFLGTLDGQNHAINGLTTSYTSTLINGTGLFGVNGGIVRNISLADVSVTGYGAGSLVGYNTGIVSNVSATGTVNGRSSDVGGLVGDNSGKIFNSSFIGTVTGTNTQVGGLVGISDSNSVIQNSYAIANVSGLSTVGGLVGELAGNSTISSSWSGGSVTAQNDMAGGLVGYFNKSGIQNSYSTSSVTAASNAGGLIGGVYGLGAGIVNSYATGKVVAGSQAGGVLGELYYGNGPLSNNYYDTQTTGQSTYPNGNGIGTPLTTAQLKAGLPAGFDPNVWAISASVNNGYPYLKWQTAAPVASTTVTLYGTANTSGGTPISQPITPPTNANPTASQPPATQPNVNPPASQPSATQSPWAGQFGYGGILYNYPPASQWATAGANTIDVSLAASLLQLGKNNEALLGISLSRDWHGATMTGKVGDFQSEVDYKNVNTTAFAGLDAKGAVVELSVGGSIVHSEVAYQGTKLTNEFASGEAGASVNLGAVPTIGADFEVMAVKDRLEKDFTVGLVTLEPYVEGGVGFKLQYSVGGDTHLGFGPIEVGVKVKVGNSLHEIER